MHDDLPCCRSPVINAIPVCAVSARPQQILPSVNVGLCIRGGDGPASIAQQINQLADAPQRCRWRVTATRCAADKGKWYGGRPHQADPPNTLHLQLTCPHELTHTADCVTIRSPPLICPRDDSCSSGGKEGNSIPETGSHSGLLVFDVVWSDARPLRPYCALHAYTTATPLLAGGRIVSLTGQRPGSNCPHTMWQSLNVCGRRIRHDSLTATVCSCVASRMHFRNDNTLLRDPVECERSLNYRMAFVNIKEHELKGGSKSKLLYCNRHFKG